MNGFLKIPAFWRGLDASRHAACLSGTAVHAIAGRALAAPGVLPGTCSRVLNVLSAQPCNQAARARAPCSRRVEHELQNALNGSGPPLAAWVGAHAAWHEGEKHWSLEDLT